MEHGNLPSGWDWIKLRKLVRINYGKGLASKQRRGGNIPVYGANGVVGYHDSSLSKGETIIIGRKGSAGAVNLSKTACWPIDTTFFVDDFPKFLKTEYLYHFLRSQPLAQLQQSAAIPGLNRDVLYEVEIPIPYPSDIEQSLYEQRRIVTRIEVLLSEVREMREINQKILEDTQQLLGAFLSQIYEYLPEKVDKTIDEIGFVKGGKRLPKGEKFADQPTQHPYLRVIDFRNFTIDETDLRYLTPEVYQRIRNYTISHDDVFVSIAGTIGLVGIVPFHLSGSNLTENAAKIVFRPEYQDKIKNKYLMYYLASPQGQKQIEERTKAAGQPKLALERIKTITFPFIDSRTQQELIIQKIESVQTEISEMLRGQQADGILMNQFEESILVQAFQGKL